jgi:hypothetical protein
MALMALMVMEAVKEEREEREEKVGVEAERVEKEAIGLAAPPEVEESCMKLK